MQEKRVIVIEPTQVIHEDINGLPTLKPKLKVCAYARVSTDSEDQLHSVEAQKSVYTQKIQENDDWDFIGLYADEGLSGTSIQKRPQFLQMIEDAKAGKIDLILTKSLSRFARNTVDTLTIIRELREINVDVFFEKENIYSSDTKVDFMLTIFSSIAQEEARNISENVKWGFRKRFKEGKVHINTKRFLGYDKDDDGNIVINEEQAKTVTIIYDMYISGSSLKEIVIFLTENELQNGRGEIFWTPATVSAILTNEKYCGDAILQKRVTVDYLTHKSVKNDGHAPKYYIMNNHEPIVSRTKFELVQELKKKRGRKRKQSNYGNIYPLSGIVFCGKCGAVMNRSYYNYGKATERVVLTCRKNNKEHVCSNKPIDNDTLEKAIVKSIKELELSKDTIIDETLEIVRSCLSSSELETEISDLKKQITKTEKSIKDIIDLNVNSIADNTEFYKSIYNEKKAQLIDLKAQLNNKKSSLVNGHLHEERIQEMKEFLDGNIGLNKNILMGTYKFIIALKPSEALLLISDNPMTKKSIKNELEVYKAMPSIHTDKVKSTNEKYEITYHVVDLREQE
jgi:DNA invertase Pin-like site-specific DNA recombinase